MPIGNSSIAQVAYVQETAFGVTPTTGTTRLLRVTGESLDYTVNKEASEEINNTRSVSSVTVTGASASGGLDTEVSYLEYDPLLAAALQSDFNIFGVNGVGATFTATFTANTITASVATAGASIFTNLRRGQFFRLVAPTTPNDGRILRVSTTVAPTSTVITLDANTPLVVGASIANCTVSSSRLTNGATQRSFSIERQNSDIPEFWNYRGMTVDNFEFKAAAEARSTFNFTFMGRKAARAITTQLPGTATESRAFDIHAGGTGPACYLWVDGAPLPGTFVMSASISYSNALRAQAAVCEVGAIGVGSGTIEVKANLEVYFANGALFDRLEGNQNVSFVVSTLDNSGNGYVFTLPKASVMSVSTGAGGKDQDMMLSVELLGLRDNANAEAALRQVLFIDRVGVAAV